MEPKNDALISDKVEEVYPGVVCEWFNESKIVAYRITLVTEATINKWAEIVYSTLEAWDKRRPYLAMHDLSAGGVSLLYASLTNFDLMNIGVTPMMKYKAEEFFNQNTSFFGRVAVNFNMSFSGRMGKVLTSTLLDSHPSVGYKTFYSRNKSLAWLADSINVSNV